VCPYLHRSIEVQLGAQHTSWHGQYHSEYNTSKLICQGTRGKGPGNEYQGTLRISEQKNAQKAQPQDCRVK
ncbi:MAG: hypothetical protein LBP22_17575, partial [Deltaproteobacteria bacterium]|nr:hypothetical protein [Deltaproteobacteria bacterium]